MENRIEISLLLDYYGSLLTQKQYEIMDMYYNENLSLSEIADIQENTRQAIHDLIHRTSNKLFKFEENLHIKEDSIKREIKKDKLKEIVLNLKDEDKITEIISLIEDI